MILRLLTMSSERSVLITGGTRGIGFAIAQRLASRGDRIALAASASIDQAREAARVLANEFSTPAIPLVVDIRDAESCAQGVADVVEEFGGLDVLVNNAGINYRATAMESIESEWNSVMDTNVNGTFRMTTAAYTALKKSKGNIVNLSSTAGQIAVRGSAAYAVSKAAIIQFTRVLALELAEEGIRVNAVAPTIVPTDMTRELLTDDAYMKAKLSTIPLGEVVLTSDVAHAVAWLSSTEARMITGQTLFVDGGVTVA
jgi:NAD(P)-dependent dehydrogenase (short-subunit alcohol dehydrogenase family)